MRLQKSKVSYEASRRSKKLDEFTEKKKNKQEVKKNESK